MGRHGAARPWRRCPRRYALTKYRLERWWGRFELGSELAEQLDEVAAVAEWPRRPQRTATAARAVYLHQPAGSMLWRARGEVEPLDPVCLRDVFSLWAIAAEPSGLYHDDG